ncbi:MAG: hypothetical protein COX40_04225 [Candidatus Omnitrophica bacterium CG23_combo_of_CG06-09_8_20_14_all_40_11]|nr:MAG: hypothetical protein COX40_04225 [Candidatus Omnitrophica bacterium CG23_combo_of_CG06-09_8_20_14_all_40_11]
MEKIAKRYQEALILALIISIIVSVRIIYLLQFQSSPLALITPSGLDTAFNHRLAIQLLGGESSRDFLFSSFYSYFLASIYRIFGINIEAARIIQMMLGIISCILVYLVTKELFGKSVAKLALCLQGLYSLFIFQEGILISTTLGIFLSLILTFWLMYIQKKSFVLGFYIAGLILGVLCKTLNVSLPLILLLSLWIMRLEKGLRLKLRSLFIFFLGVLTTLAIFILPNFSILKESLPIPAHSGINFYIGNNPEADGTFWPPLNMHSSQLGLLKDSQLIAEKNLGRPLNNKEINWFWFKKGFAYIASHPYAYLKLTLRKFLIFINGYEPQDIEDFYFAKKFIPLLRFPFISFYFISALGILGWVVCIRKPEASVIKLFILGYGISNILYFVTSRYRLPAVPYFIILASYGLFWLTKRLSAGNLNRIIWLICLLAFLFFLTNIRIFKHDFSYAFYNLSVKYIDTDNVSKALESAQEAIRINPHIAPAYFNLGIISYRQGKIKEATDNFLKTLELNPNYFEAHYNLGFIYEEAGDPEKAIKYYLSSLKINPQDEQVYFNLGCAYLKTGQQDLAKQAFGQAMRLNPRLIPQVKEILSP